MLNEKVIPKHQDEAVSGPENKVQKVGDESQPLEESTATMGTESAEGNNDMSNENLNPTPETIATPLPEGVTEEPRDETELPMSEVDRITGGNFTPYLAAGDNRNILLNDDKLTQQIQSFDPEKIAKKPGTKAELLAEVSAGIANITGKLYGKEGEIDGILTYYHILLAQGLLVAKKLVKETDHKWIKWLNDQNFRYSVRSLQTYMRMGIIPGSIKYTFLGQERLLKLVDVLIDLFGKDLKDCPDVNDPIGWLLHEHCIVIDLEHEWDHQDSNDRANIDKIPVLRKIEKKANQFDLTLDAMDLDQAILLKAVKVNPNIDPGRIETLCEIKKAGGNPNEFLADLANSSTPKPNVDKAVKNRSMIKIMDTTANQLKNIFENISEKPLYIQDIKLETVKQIAKFAKKIIEAKKGATRSNQAA